MPISRAPISTSTASLTSSIRFCSATGCPITPIPNRCGWSAGSAPSPASSRSPTRSIASRSRSAPRSSASTASTRPITTTLSSLLAEAQQDFGCAVLIDCHSMPSNPIADQGGGRPDFVLGDRFGTSCSGELTRLAGEPAQGAGLCRGPQQALCRRLHHRALRPPAQGPARAPDRDQPRPLYG